MTYMYANMYLQYTLYTHYVFFADSLIHVVLNSSIYIFAIHIYMYTVVCIVTSYLYREGHVCTGLYITIYIWLKIGSPQEMAPDHLDTGVPWRDTDFSVTTLIQDVMGS